MKTVKIIKDLYKTIIYNICSRIIAINIPEDNLQGIPIKTPVKRFLITRIIINATLY